MKLSFEGVRANALRQLRDIEKIAKTVEDYDEYEHQIGMIEMCISAYHDCLLALMRGEVDAEEIKGFLLAYKTPEEIAALPYCGMVVKFTESEKA
jgi:hypothetical protein